MRWDNRIIIIIAALASLIIIVPLATQLTVQVIHSATQGIQNLFHPLGMSGDARLEGVIKLCLYLIGITLLVRHLFGPRGKG
jgi:hypothetical protein